MCVCVCLYACLRACVCVKSVDGHMKHEERFQAGLIELFFTEITEHTIVHLACDRL